MGARPASAGALGRGDMATVALIGPDGAGKSTVARQVWRELGRPAAYLYMGINLESSNVLMPSTRLVRQLQRRRSRSRATGQRRDAPDGGRPYQGAGSAIRSLLRVSYQMAEEWYRQLLAWYHQARGRIVVFDRHFYLDYHAYDVADRHRSSQPIARRLHGLMLERLYPRPNLVIYLDGPADVLFARKGEGTLESIDRRRREYLALRSVVRRFEVIDATRPVDEVIDEVARVIRATFSGGASDADRAPGS